jgi:predicted  nucleic acid-binding Zn-ribbon protein
MNDLYFEYKNDYGYYPSPDEEYIKWLENKITELKKELSLKSEYPTDYRADYEDAVNEIGVLQDQLADAEQEIRELNRQIP